MIKIGTSPDISEEEKSYFDNQMSKVNKQRVEYYTCVLILTENIGSNIEDLEIEENGRNQFDH